MKLYVPKNDKRIISSLFGVQREEDSIRVYSYKDINGNIFVNYAYIEDDCCISNDLLECWVYDIPQDMLNKIELNETYIAEVPLYETVVYVLESKELINTLLSKYLEIKSISYGNNIYG